MSRRALVILGVICLALIVAATEPWWSGWGGSGGSSKAAPFSTHGFTSDATTGVTIQRTGQPTVTLTKSGSTWMVNDKPSDSSQVSALFTALGGLHVGSLVSRNASNGSQFGVTGPTATTIVLTRSGSSSTFVVGNSAPDPSAFFMKKAGSNDVYEVTGGLSNAVDQPLSAWQFKPAKKPAATGTPTPVVSAPVTKTA